MRNLFYLSLLVSFTLFSCTSSNKKANYLVTTKVQIQEGKINEVLNLFKETNPELVKDQKDWVKATFSKNKETNTVMVQAYWIEKDSYLAFSKSKNFQNTMKQFGQYFARKPVVEINELLFEM